MILIHHTGTQHPMASGKVQLAVVPDVPVVFCSDVTLNEHLFHPHAKLHIFLTLTWDSPSAHAHDATAVWSENVRPTGFTGKISKHKFDSQGRL